MPEPDALAERFAAFRDTVSAATDPPGVPAARRRLARRDAFRTAAIAAVAAGLAAVFILLGATTKPVAPTGPPTVGPSPTASGPGGSSVDSQPSPTLTSATPTTAATKALRCRYGGYGGPVISLSGTTLYAEPGDFWSRCATTRLRVYSVVYEWDVDQQRYTRAHLANIYLTTAQRTAPMPAADLDPIASVCGYAWLVVASDVDPPTVLPTSLTNAATPDSSYWQDHGFGNPIQQEWNTVPANHQFGVCQPTTPSSSP